MTGATEGLPCRWRARPERIVSFHTRLYGADATLRTHNEHYTFDRYLVAPASLPSSLRNLKVSAVPITSFLRRDTRAAAKKRRKWCRGKYNMGLTGAAFIDADTHFPAYWSPATLQARALVDSQHNCEDILMNFVVGNATASAAAQRSPITANASHQAVEFVRAPVRLDLGSHSGADRASKRLQSCLLTRYLLGSNTQHEVVRLVSCQTNLVCLLLVAGVGISRRAAFGAQRDRCLRVFSQVFGKMPLSPIDFDYQREAPPVCSIPGIGCFYPDGLIDSIGHLVASLWRYRTARR